ncbi:MAG: hypothetical protein R2853_13910 [Thermomicrobiales bacterium]|nr:hypothetical protein [Thermomicrobiales bacterium]
MLDAYRDLIDELLSTPTEIRGLLQDVDVPAPDAVALIAELRDRDLGVLARAQRMTREDTPYLNADQDVPHESREASEILAEMEAARGDLVSLLINLSLKDWERGAIHPTRGEIVLADEIEAHVEFDEAQRVAIRKSLSQR